MIPDHAENPKNLRWARNHAIYFTRDFKRAQADAIAAAYLALTVAARQPCCPADLHAFQATAYCRVRGAIMDEIHRHYPYSRHRREAIPVVQLEDYDRAKLQGDGPDEWSEWREQLARRLPPDQARLFLAMYGPEEYTSARGAGRALGIHYRTAQRLHNKLITRIRDYIDAQETRPQERPLPVA